jgi:hypothetical protein
MVDDEGVLVLWGNAEILNRSHFSEIDFFLAG